MAKCPHCKKEIDSVTELQDVTILYEMTVNENGLINYNEFDSTDGDHMYYQCPECYADLDLRSEDEVADFLNGAI